MILQSRNGAEQRSGVRLSATNRCLKPQGQQADHVQAVLRSEVDALRLKLQGRRGGQDLERALEASERAELEARKRLFALLCDFVIVCSCGPSQKCG